MTLIIEDGTVVADANSYVTTSELTSYATARGITIPDADREKYLVLAMDYLESLNFIGVVANEDQSLSWPRAYGYTDEYLIASDSIPTLLKEGQMEIAIAIFQGNSPLAVAERAVKRERVYGAVEIEYMDNAASRTVARTINIKLSRLLRNTGSVFFRVDRV